MEDNKFKIGETATITISGIIGEVIGIVNYKYHPKEYYIAYMEVGVAKKTWFLEAELS